MHFYYLDEAGCTGEDLNNSEQPLFVSGGLSVRDEGNNQNGRINLQHGFRRLKVWEVSSD